MPQVSRRLLPRKTEEELLKQLNVVLAKISKTEEMNFFLGALFTKTERLMLAKRLAAVVLLQEELPDNDIAETLHLTRMTVSRIRYFFESRGQGYKVALIKIAREKELKVLKQILLKLVAYSIRAAGGRP